MPDLPPEQHRLAPDRAPTPFSAAEIAASCRPGRCSVYLIEEGDAPGIRQATRFVGGDAHHADLETTIVGADGAPVGEPTAARVAWADLQAHASYPADGTTIGRERIAVPAGEFDCWRYDTVVDGSSTTCWFAVDLPGPPVLKIDEIAGRRVSTMTLVELELPPG